MATVKAPCASCGVQTSDACSRCGRATCIRCIREHSVGKAVRWWCAPCHTGVNAPQALPRPPQRPPTPFCYLATCRFCGSEVYRREHIKRKTGQLKDQLRQETRWAWMRHAHSVGHSWRNLRVRRYNGEIDKDAVIFDHLVMVMWLNETVRHPDMEAGEGEPLPEHMRISTVMRDLGAPLDDMGGGKS